MAILTIAQRLKQRRVIKDALKQHSHDLRVALPGIINSFDATTQTANVQVTIREQVLDVDGSPTSVEFPLLLDVLLVVPRAGGFSLTLPVTAGDECLVVFADMCIDAWWQSGGVQEQATKRRHNLSDGFAILGPWSQPRKLVNYSSTSAQLRSDDGQTLVDLKSGQVTVKASTVQVNAQTATVTASGSATVQGQTVTIGSATKIDGKVFLTHTHSGVSTGTGVSGPVV